MAFDTEYSDGPDKGEEFQRPAGEQQAEPYIEVDGNLKKDGAADDLLLELARQELELFHDEHGRAYARRREGDATAFPVMSTTCSSMLERAFKRATGVYPKRTAVRAAQHPLASEALHEGERRKIYLRVGGTPQETWLDLGPGRSVRIVPGGWEVVERPSVMFSRPSTSKELPNPVRGVDGLERLRKVFDFLTEPTYRLVLGWTLMCLSPAGPYPLLALVGESGSLKTTLLKALKLLIDPTSASAQPMPKNEQDLAISCDTNAVLGLDNLGGLAPAMSDALCRVLSGGGFSTRELYTTGDERIWEHQRPIVLTGIGAVITQQDLLNRTIVCSLKQPRLYVAEDEFRARFEIERPAILGGLLDVLATLLERLPSMTERRPVRMADFVRWIEAAEPALGWEAGSFVELYLDNQNESQRASLDGSPVAAAVLAFMREYPTGWQGSPTQLHSRLEPVGNQKLGRGWPTNAQQLGKALTLLKPALRLEGIEIEKGSEGRGDEKKRIIRITHRGTVGTRGTQEGAV